MSNSFASEAEQTLSAMMAEHNEAEEARRQEREAREHALAERLVASGLAALFFDAVTDERLAVRDAMRKGEGMQERLRRKAVAKARTEALRQAVRLAYATPADPKGWEAQTALFAATDAIKADEGARSSAIIRASRIRRDV